MNENNKQAAINFLEMIIAGDIDKAYENYISPELIHHNPFYPGDAASLQKGMEDNHYDYPNKIFEIQHAIADGNLVAVHSHLQMYENDEGMATVHILRFDNDKIVEMWDVAKQVPDNVINEKGMF